MLMFRMLYWPSSHDLTWLFGDNQGAEAAAVEHHDVRGAGFWIEMHERADQDAEWQTQIAWELRRRIHLLVVTGVRIL